ncbi:helix-turn-helix transcriptional regulator [Clostridium sp. D2Q-14]|uniref:helix-turn-helix transcriptional regulator n=1 Tax=Anaeromonas gelatinilytica TaxID=2683194 RepID=UPI00193BB48C|nr:helix-turn-helix transcriptional regulator [Anaeromonas gelatinilytica]MBS4534892.1 helix-turn-helix transcriptional regulator [Anaeromonas gelatinilytica]
MNKQTDNYIEICYEYSFGMKLPQKIDLEMLPDILTLHNPIELQEVTFIPSGKGVWKSYSYRPTMIISFDMEHFNAQFFAHVHKHDYIELIINISDFFTMQVESKICNFEKFDICIPNRSVRHSEFFDRNLKLVYLAFSVDYIEQLLLSNTDMPKQLKLFMNKSLYDSYLNNRNYMFFKCKSFHAISLIHHLIDNIRIEFEKKQPGYQLIIQGLLCRYFHILFDELYYDIDYVDLNSDNGHSLASSAKQLIDRDAMYYQKDILSNLLNYNGDYINRIFKKHYGYSLSEYSRIVRLQNVAHTLISTNLSIHEICSRFGFINRTYFYRIFKEKYNCSPNEYRNIHKIQKHER